MAFASMGWKARAACAGEQWFVEDAPAGQAGRLDMQRRLGVCAGCEVLDDCRAWAAGFTWTSVVVGGWVAPGRGARPPWERAA